MSPEAVRECVEADRDRLFASYAVGRPAHWTCDQWTKDFVCLSVWLREHLEAQGLDAAGIRAVGNVFYRFSRQDSDLFQLVSELLEDVRLGRIERDRIGHRRWG